VDAIVLADGGRGVRVERIEKADGVGLGDELADCSVVGPAERGDLVVGGELAAGDLEEQSCPDRPLVHGLVLIVDRWSTGKAPNSWLFGAPAGGPLRESNWKRSVGWSAATASAGLQGFRVHDLRHTAAPVWLGAGADPKVVQRVLGHASAAMTMDPYGHLVDGNLWQVAQAVGGIWGASDPDAQDEPDEDEPEEDENSW